MVEAEDEVTPLRLARIDAARGIGERIEYEVPADPAGWLHALYTHHGFLHSPLHCQDLCKKGTASNVRRLIAAILQHPLTGIQHTAKQKPLNDAVLRLEMFRNLQHRHTDLSGHSCWKVKILLKVHCTVRSEVSSLWRDRLYLLDTSEMLNEEVLRVQALTELLVVLVLGRRSHVTS